MGNGGERRSPIAGHDRLVYKIVKAENGKRVIVGYSGMGDAATASGTAKDLNGKNLAAGEYALYIWAQKSNAVNSHEGSAPMYFKLNVTGSGAQK